MWIYNQWYMQFDEDYMSDKLRERKPGEHARLEQSKSAESPAQMMLAAGNRNAILKKD